MTAAALVSGQHCSVASPANVLADVLVRRRQTSGSDASTSDETSIAIGATLMPLYARRFGS